MKNKLILTDADGVLLDWEWAFSVWMQERGYTLTADNKKSYYLHHHYNELEEKDAKRLLRLLTNRQLLAFFLHFVILLTMLKGCMKNTDISSVLSQV